MMARPKSTNGRWPRRSSATGKPNSIELGADTERLATVAVQTIVQPAGFRAARVFGGDPTAGLIRIRVVPPAFGCSISKAFVFRTRSLSLREPIGPRIEIGGQVGKPFSDFPETDPAVLAFHLGDDLLDHRGGCIRGLEQLRPRGGILSVRRAAKQVLGIDESSAGLPEAFRRLLLAEPDTHRRRARGCGRQVA